MEENLKCSQCQRNIENDNLKIDDAVVCYDCWRDTVFELVDWYDEYKKEESQNA